MKYLKIFINIQIFEIKNLNKKYNNKYNLKI